MSEWEKLSPLEQTQPQPLPVEITSDIAQLCFPILAIGALAGGLEVWEAFFTISPAQFIASVALAIEKANECVFLPGTIQVCTN